MPSNRAERGEFMTSLLAHDISNYNQTTRGYLEMLLDEQMGPLTDEQNRALTICLRQSGRIQSLIESVRLIHEVEGTESRLEPADLDEAIREAVVQVQTAFADREVRVRFIPGGRRALSEGHLTTIFRHIIGNAARHNDSEVIEVDIEVSRAGDKAPWTVKVIDNGEGIPAARQAELFDRLERLSIHGSGLGLSLVKLLVERCGGRVWLESREAGGTIVGVELPSA
jgi:signal transduction histidine kinase